MRNLITIVERIYYQKSEFNPLNITNGFDREVSSDEQLYVRNTKVGLDWIKLDLGWIKSPGMIIIKNDNPKHSSGIIQLGIAVPNTGIIIFSTILPKEHLRYQPTLETLQGLVIRSQESNSPYTIIAIPG